MASKAITKLQALIIVVVIVIAGAAGGAYYYATLPKGPERILLGVTVPLTGGAGWLGQEAKAAYEFATEDINKAGGIYLSGFGRKIPVEVIYYDDKTDPTTAAANLERLITVDKVDFVFGEIFSSLVFATAGVAEKHKIPFVATQSGLLKVHEQGFKNVFVVYFSSRQIVEEPMKFIREKVKPSSVAWWADDSAVGQELTVWFKKLLPGFGWKVVDEQTLTMGQKDFTAQILKAKAANPDVLMLFQQLTPDGMTLHRQFKELDFAPKLVYQAGPPAAAYEWGDILKKDGNYVMIGQPWDPAVKTPGNKELVDRFVTKMRANPSGNLGVEYATAQVLFDAIQRAGSLDRDKVREALAKTDLNTIIGKVTFDMVDYPGRAITPNYMIQWQNMEKKIVWPSDAANAEFKFPTPSWKERG